MTLSHAQTEHIIRCWLLEWQILGHCPYGMCAEAPKWQQNCFAMLQTANMLNARDKCDLWAIGRYYTNWNKKGE